MPHTTDAVGNRFLTRPLAGLYVATAAPIILIMGMNGLLTIVDAWFLGAYVGADALGAVTLMFPFFMLLVALATLVSGGMSSLLARRLGAGDTAAAREVFAGAHGLALIICLAVIVLYAAGGRATIDAASGGRPDLATMGADYISVLAYCSPVAFFLTLQSDALRCEGRVGLMAAIALGTSIANIALDYILIGVLDFGVAGSAWGTVLAQTIALSAALAFRLRGKTPLALGSLPLRGLGSHWPRFLALGAPQSLTFLGISLGSGAIIAAVRHWNAGDYAATIAAYGIVTRILTFAYLPMLGLSLSMQTITGNNFGAALWHRSDASLRLAFATALVYGASVQVTLLLARRQVGAIFVEDPATIAEVARILPMLTALYVVAGPVMVLSAHFQAVGDAARAAALSLTRTYAFAIPLTFLLPMALGERGIWIAAPSSEAMMILVTAGVLAQARFASGHRLGVFRDGAH